MSLNMQGKDKLHARGTELIVRRQKVQVPALSSCKPLAFTYSYCHFQEYCIVKGISSLFDQEHGMFYSLMNWTQCCVADVYSITSALFFQVCTSFRVNLEISSRLANICLPVQNITFCQILNLGQVSAAH